MQTSRVSMRGCLALVIVAGLPLAACDRPEAPPKRQEALPPHTPFVEDGAPSASAVAQSAAESGESAAPAPAYTVSRLGQKAGLWQLTQTLPQLGGKSVARICVDDAQGEKLALIGHDLPGKKEMAGLECTARSVNKTGNGADIETVCMVDETTLRSRIHVDIVGNEAFHQTVETRYSPAFAGHGSQMTVTDGKRLGDCPADMKPGDYITGDGVRLKAGKVLAKFR